MVKIFDDMSMFLVDHVWVKVVGSIFIALILLKFCDLYICPELQRHIVGPSIVVSGWKPNTKAFRAGDAEVSINVRITRKREDVFNIYGYWYANDKLPPIEMARPVFGGFTSIGKNKFSQPITLPDKSLFPKVGDQLCYDAIYMSLSKTSTTRPIRTPRVCWTYAGDN
jgi:hypothetical protein